MKESIEQGWDLTGSRIQVTGNGTNNGSPYVSFPGVYKANDPGILINIYDSNGKPDNSGKPYTIPGPQPITC